MTEESRARAVVEAVTGRRSVRRFLPTPVPLETVTAILEAASRAPSGTNTQPWHVHVVAGEARARLCEAVLAAARAGERSEEYAYAPARLKDHHHERRRRVGYALYSLYGVERTDLAGRREAMLRNFTFFGAPVGLFFTLDRGLLRGSWLDVGMFMQNVMVLARAYDLGTCPQQAWCDYGAVVRRCLGVPEDEIIVSGMALGRPDPGAPENGLVSERAPVAEFAVFHDA